MDLTKQTLEGAQFRSRGKWYLAEQVDEFLEALKASVEEDCREEEQAAREAQRLKEENTRLQQALEAAQKSGEELSRQLEEARKELVSRPAEERQRRVCQELEQERDELIEDIKALRSFRESFRQAVVRDGEQLLGQVKALPSEELL